MKTYVNADQRLKVQTIFENFHAVGLKKTFLKPQSNKIIILKKSSNGSNNILFYKTKK